MLSQERHAIILEMLREHNIVKISDIAARFNISNLTARRDVDTLQSQNLVRRIHGGAILVSPSAISTESPKAYRSTIHKELRAIGKLAASLVQEGESLFVGNGSTTLAAAHYLRGMSSLTILTSSLSVINELVGTDNTLYALGGYLDYNELFFSGTFAQAMLEQFSVDKAIIGCGGISMGLGVLEYNPDGANLHRTIVRNSSRTILVCSSSKFRNNALSIVCPLTDIDVLVTDENLSDVDREKIRQLGIELYLAPVHTPGDEEEAP